MARYRINLVNVGSFTVEVEAESEDEAFDLAYDMAPEENIYTGFDMGEWTTAGELWPDSPHSFDIELIEEG